MHRLKISMLPALAVLLTVSPPVAARQNVAVFNFQMSSDTPQWVWLEKFLSDQITTDFSRASGLTVVARDQMQLIAQKVRWAAEMATTDPDRMAQIRRQLQYLRCPFANPFDDKSVFGAPDTHRHRRALISKLLQTQHQGRELGPVGTEGLGSLRDGFHLLRHPFSPLVEPFAQQL